MSLLKAIKAQLGLSTTPANNFTLDASADNGTMKLARGNAGATTQDILNVDAQGKVAFPQGMAARTDVISMVRVYSASGYGSSSTRFRRFATVDTNTGSDITYADSATLGASFTINTSGVYAISYSDQFANSETAIITINDTAPTAVPNQAEVLAACSSASANWVANAAWIGRLPAGAVIRARSGAGTATGTSTWGNHFTIARVS